MSQFLEYNTKFLEKALSSAQILTNVYSAIPSLVFLASSFLFLYQHLHKNTTRHTRWKTRIIREIKFQWIYFNVSRLWYIFISCCRRLLGVAEDYIQLNIREEDKEASLLFTEASALICVSSLAITPLFLSYVNYFTRHDMPNFLMWVMEDPYLRHEIGIAGHCLERPLRVEQLKSCPPYRSRRSTSFEARPGKAPVICRSCKSLIENNVVNSIDEMIN